MLISNTESSCGQRPEHSPTSTSNYNFLSGNHVVVIKSKASLKPDR